MGGDISVKVEGVEAVAKELGDLLSPSKLKQLNKAIGINVRERTADWIGRASVSRHKSSDRLGAMHTSFLEFAPARGMLRGGSNFKGKTEDDGTPFTEVRDISSSGVSIVIGNTPGLRRAFHSLTITPKKAKALTIPINKVSYARSVSELKAEGHNIFRPNGKRILAEVIGKGKSSRLRPLYALCEKTVIPHDPELLPDSDSIKEWSEDTVEAFLEMMTRG